MDVKHPDTAATYPFLQGGGDMGELTRAFDWQETSLGPVETWPLSLRTTLGLLLNSAFPMVLFWGKELICFYNDAFRPSLGLSGKHPAIGKKAEDVWPESWDFIGPLIRQVMDTGKPVWFEDQLVPSFRNSKIEDIYWTFSYSPAYGDNGKIAGVFVTCTETTGKMQTVKRAEESEQQIRSLVESAPFPIGVYHGKDMKIVFANKSITDVWGKGSDVIGKLYSEVLPELENQEIFGQLDSVFSTGIPFHAKYQRVDLMVDGELKSHYFNYSFTPLFDASGHVYGVMNTAAEVTDLHLAKEKVEQSERNFRNIILQAPVAMCLMMGPQHTVELVNEQMMRIWGKSLAEVIHKPVFEGLPDAREQGLEQLLDEVYQKGITVNASERPVSLLRNGKTDIVYQNFVYEPYTDVSGNILGVLAISLDVTAQVVARHKIEEVVTERTGELAAANERLKISNEELEQFAYIASHDLQEPIRKVGIYSQMLELNLGKIDDRSASYLNKINSSAVRMTRLIRDVLSYSQTSKDHQLFEEVSIETIIRDIIVDFELLIEQKKARIIFSQLPVIEAIPLQMSQLFGNLVSNALKFSKPDIPLEITLTSRLLSTEEKTANGYANDRIAYFFEIKDNGIGFQQEHAEKIFNIFQRLHGKTEYSGTGIGLALCKKIAQNHEGYISAVAHQGSGATFNVILPAKQK